MHLIAIIVALWLHGRVDGHLPWRDEQRQLRALGGLQERIEEWRVWDGAVGLAVVVLPPVLIVGVVQLWLGDALLGLVELVLGLGLLLWALGEGRVDAALKRMARALAAGQREEAAREAGQLAPGTVVADDPTPQTRNALAGAFQRAGDTVFAPVFWFLLLGPVGIVLYRVSYLAWRYSARSANPGPRFRRSADGLFLLLAWLPSRLTALSLGLAGSLGDAWRGWQLARSGDGDGHRAALQGAGFGALRFPERDAALDDPAYWLREGQSLLFRTLVIWLAVIAVLSLAGWVG
ncbi:regulatory signaling modulator protein AmpE [Aquisalimonas sp.]|uniref:regulatory signaling modulator protein AmpE n=1 Tax=unclassified Aquisalimonas TaxID=2644645 RepID=UPI0025C20842|nr:regulatory signaling modulator protein AmpE [Aquisalimonas sp.]